MPEMARRSKVWARLVSRWDDLENSMRDEVGLDWEKGDTAERTYDLIQALIYDEAKS